MQAKGIARRLTPILVGVREEVKEDKYTLVCIRSHDHATSRPPWYASDHMTMQHLGHLVMHQIT